MLLCAVLEQKELLIALYEFVIPVSFYVNIFCLRKFQIILCNVKLRYIFVHNLLYFENIFVHGLKIFRTNRITTEGTLFATFCLDFSSEVEFCNI